MALTVATVIYVSYVIRSGGGGGSDSLFTTLFQFGKRFTTPAAAATVY